MFWYLFAIGLRPSELREALQADQLIARPDMQRAGHMHTAPCIGRIPRFERGQKRVAGVEGHIIPLLAHMSSRICLVCMDTTRLPRRE